MSIRLDHIRSKMGFTIHVYRDTDSNEYLARGEPGDVLAIDSNPEVAFWRGWSSLSGLRPFSVVRNHFGRFRFVATSAVPMDSAVVSITYPAWGSRDDPLPAGRLRPFRPRRLKGPTMSRYFTISHGLRGCYMPDSAEVVRVDTRRALKEHVAEVVARLDYPFGGSKGAVAEVVAKAWRSPKEWRDFVIPLAETKGAYRFGVFISNLTRADYLAQEGDE